MSLEQRRNLLMIYKVQFFELSREHPTTIDQLNLYLFYVTRTFLYLMWPSNLQCVLIYIKFLKQLCLLIYHVEIIIFEQVTFNEEAERN